MKVKHLLGIAFVAVVGGVFAYQLLNKKERWNITPVADDNVETPSEEIFEEHLEQDNVVANKEEMCDVTMRQVYENMSIRNEEAKDILADIHDDMKKSEDNIASKKADIEKMMENLKNKGD